MVEGIGFLFFVFCKSDFEHFERNERYIYDGYGFVRLHAVPSLSGRQSYLLYTTSFSIFSIVFSKAHGKTITRLRTSTIFFLLNVRSLNFENLQIITINNVFRKQLFSD